MRILIVDNPEDKKILQSESEDINFKKDAIDIIVHNMKNTLSDSKNGVGLAANQIGILKRMFIMDAKRSGHARVFINPTILKYIGNTYKSLETCLSLPGRETSTMRYSGLLLKWDNIYGQMKVKTFLGFEGKIIQHEMDHLNGILI